MSTCSFLDIPTRMVGQLSESESRFSSWMVVNSFQAIDYDGRFFVNPGSATGAWSSYLNG
jgi:hypothetical protein